MPREAPERATRTTSHALTCMCARASIDRCCAFTANAAPKETARALPRHRLCSLDCSLDCSLGATTQQIHSTALGPLIPRASDHTYSGASRLERSLAVARVRSDATATISSHGRFCLTRARSHAPECCRRASVHWRRQRRLRLRRRRTVQRPTARTSTSEQVSDDSSSYSLTRSRSCSRTSQSLCFEPPRRHEAALKQPPRTRTGERLHQRQYT